MEKTVKEENMKKSIQKNLERQTKPKRIWKNISWWKRNNLIKFYFLKMNQEFLTFVDIKTEELKNPYFK